MVFFLKYIYLAYLIQIVPKQSMPEKGLDKRWERVKIKDILIFKETNNFNIGDPGIDYKKGFSLFPFWISLISKKGTYAHWMSKNSPA